jgi:hypothetical protein
MKKLIFTAALVLSSLTYQIANAQLRVHVNLNIGSQPDWGPTGYDHVDYYYMPDVDAYYDVPSHQYVYFENNVWVHRAYLPERYRGYDMYHGYKVVVNRPNPWLRHTYYRNTYASYRGRAGQTIIRDSRDVRYRDHWNGGPGRGNGPGRDYGHGGPGRGGDHHDNGNHGGDHHDNGNHGGDHHDNGNHGGPGRGGDHGDRGHGRP